VEHDTAFPMDRLRPSLYGTLRALGIRLEDQPNVRLDLERRAAKSPRAFCAAIEVPDEVWVVQFPLGGRADYGTLLQEAAHAEYYATRDRTQPFAYRRLGDRALLEGYGYLFQYLTMDPPWLRWQLELDEMADVTRLAAFEKLYRLRRAALQLQFEQELHAVDEPESMAERFAELFTEQLGVRFFAECYLEGVEDHLYVAQRLRGWMLETYLRSFLKSEYDEEWFRSARAGRFLIDRWREGQRYTADELVRFMGFDTLDTGPLVEELSAILSG
jgi:hypothetical protein